MNEQRVLDISWGTIVKLSIAALIIYVVFLIRDLLIWILFGIIISIIFDPALDFLKKRRVPRTFAAVGLYLIVFGLIAFAIYATAPLFIGEVQRFSQFLPRYLENLLPALEDLGIAAFSDLDALVSALTENVQENSANILRALGAIFGGIFSTIFVISIALFLSIEEKAMERMLLLLFPKRYEIFVLDVWRRSQRKVAGWFFSRVLSSIFVGAATYAALALFDVRYPLILSLISGFLNFIPIIGPFIAGFIVVIVVAFDPVTFATGGINLLRVVFVVLAMILIQQIESYILTPLLTKRFIGMSPVLVLVALAIGGELWGIMGAILAIPLFGIVFEFFRDFLQRRREEETATPLV
ncbi:MAG: AI-2E family transporter [Candidatus Wildermuthbacteria bacterium]|nr:AI-2E family transporter [Candidatus Wildermuthbacteria bacterium]